jgi:hypothetical protein
MVGASREARAEVVERRGAAEPSKWIPCPWSPASRPPRRVRAWWGMGSPTRKYPPSFHLGAGSLLQGRSEWERTSTGWARRHPPGPEPIAAERPSAPSDTHHRTIPQIQAPPPVTPACSSCWAIGWVRGHHRGSGIVAGSRAARLTGLRHRRRDDGHGVLVGLGEDIQERGAHDGIAVPIARESRGIRTRWTETPNSMNSSHDSLPSDQPFLVAPK